VRELRIALLQIAAAGYDQAANLETGLAVCRHAAELGAGRGRLRGAARPRRSARLAPP